jgi:hypothetical protein
MVCFRYIIVNTPHKGDKDNNNNNNNDNIWSPESLVLTAQDGKCLTDHTSEQFSTFVGQQG